MLRNALLLLTLAVLAPLAFAQTTWNGGTSTNWGDAANWSAGVPTAATDAIISGSASTMPTLNVAGSCLSLTINSGATLNAGAQTLTVNGNWTNNGTFTAGTSNVIFGGTATATVGGTAATSFYKVTVTKGALATTVTQNAAVTTTLAGTSDSLDIQVGTWVTNGQNLTVAGRVNSTGTATGELRVTVGGTVNLNNIYGWNLDYFTVQAGTVNISGLHEVVNSGHRCDFTGGVVNGRGIVCSEIPRFHKADRVILFLHSGVPDDNAFAGGMQGCLRLRNGMVEGKGVKEAAYIRYLKDSRRTLEGRP